MQQPVISNIQKFCVHDGDGIRTTVFFKGCALRCRWCHNPEAQSFSQELFTYAERCTGCGACVSACKSGAIVLDEGVAVTDRSKCTACGDCTGVCLNDARSVAGEAYTVDDLVRLLLRDAAFYETSGGGVTLSGGEVMQQPFAYIESLVKKLHAHGVSVFIDTCGDAPYDRFSALLPYVDGFLYDIKHMDEQAHIRFTGVSNRRILENLKRLSADGARIDIRVPLVPGVNDDEATLEAMIGFIRENVRAARICLLPYHAVGSDKYRRLGKPMPAGVFEQPAPAAMEEIKQRFLTAGLNNVQIGG